MKPSTYMRYAPAYVVLVDGKTHSISVYRQDAEREADRFPGSTIEVRTASLDARIAVLRAELAELEGMRRGERISVQ